MNGYCDINSFYLLALYLLNKQKDCHKIKLKKYFHLHKQLIKIFKMKKIKTYKNLHKNKQNLFIYYFYI